MKAFTDSKAVRLDESIIKEESGQSTLENAIHQELNWLHDSGMYVEKWSFVDPQQEKSKCISALDRQIQNAKGKKRLPVAIEPPERER